jgi:hypothetical protein
MRGSKNTLNEAYSHFLQFEAKLPWVGIHDCWFAQGDGDSAEGADKCHDQIHGQEQRQVVVVRTGVISGKSTIFSSDVYN